MYQYSDHNDKEIRQKLRQLARFLIEMRECWMNNTVFDTVQDVSKKAIEIDDLASVIRSELFDICIEAV